MKKILKIKSSIIIAASVAMLLSACTSNNINITFPNNVKVKNVAQNPEGVEYDKNDNTFLLSSLNAAPILKVNLDGSSKPFTSGEKFPLSTAGLQVDYKRNRLLVAGFNGTEAMDNNPKTKGTSHLRIYNLKTGILQKDINLSHLASDTNGYFANDLTVDNAGNVYITDWYAQVIYKVDLDGNANLFWKNNTGIPSGSNGIDFHKDGYLLVSMLNVNEKWLYSDFALVKIPVDNPSMAKIIKIDDSKFSAFDGMVINRDGNVVGVTNNQKIPGGNMLIELKSDDNWKSAKVINSKSITASTTLTITPENKNYVLHQDFTKPNKKTWNIEQIKF